MNRDFNNSKRDSIRERLSWLVNRPDGIVHDVQTRFNRAVILKKNGQIRLYFVEPGWLSLNFSTCGAMSRIDLDDPLNLLAVYTQAMMLTLAWNSNPARICILGLGGGRLGMVFHHHIPDVMIDCVEIDPVVVDLSETFFAVTPDDRLKLIIQDGREFMETLPSDTGYDIILVDCFTGRGHHPGRVATMEFYRACASHLAPGGVVAANLHASDPLFDRKAATFSSSFAHTYHFRHDDADVFFGSEKNPFTANSLMHIAGELQRMFAFPFHLDSLAENVHVMRTEYAFEEDYVIKDESLFETL